MCNSETRIFIKSQYTRFTRGFRNMKKKSYIGKKASIILSLSLILLITCVPLHSFATAQHERSVPYTPSPRQVELTFWTKAEAAYITVTITLYTGGYEIRDWGTVNAKDNEMWTNTEMWKSTGPTIQVVWKTTHTYSLGYLKPGAYTFTFKTWGQTVKTISFVTIIMPPPIPIIPPPLEPVIPPPIRVTPIPY